MIGEYLGCPFVPAHATNYREGRRASVDLVVIHTTEGGPGAMEAADWFHHQHQPGNASSAHFVVGQDGAVIQCVKLTDTAFAAPNGNASGVHIEHACRMMAANWTEVQLLASARLTRWLLDKFGLPADRAHVRGHVEVPGNDHTDPGPYWPWQRYMQLVGAAGAPAIWQHSDGVDVPHTAAYGLRWPDHTHHAYIVADGRYQLWHGSPEPRVKLSLISGGERRLTAVAYDAGNNELARDDLAIVIK